MVVNYALASSQAFARGRPLRPTMAAAAMNVRMAFTRRVRGIPTTLMSFYASEPLRRESLGTRLLRASLSETGSFQLWGVVARLVEQADSAMTALIHVRVAYFLFCHSILMANPRGVLPRIGLIPCTILSRLHLARGVLPLPNIEGRNMSMGSGQAWRHLERICTKGRNACQRGGDACVPARSEFETPDAALRPASASTLHTHIRGPGPEAEKKHTMHAVSCKVFPTQSPRSEGLPHKHCGSGVSCLDDEIDETWKLTLALAPLCMRLSSKLWTQSQIACVTLTIASLQRSVCHISGR